MSAKAEVELDKGAIISLLKSPEVKAALKAQANAVCARANEAAHDRMKERRPKATSGRSLINPYHVGIREGTYCAIATVGGDRIGAALERAHGCLTKALKD